MLGAGSPIQVGIIPARAGFTAAGPLRWDGAGDHPRSRGVYSRRARAARSSGGSSPLARGLPTTPRSLPGRTRIIPARAGFTSRPVRQCLLFRDHPRSRGVYDPSGCDRETSSGSSPLARGLPTTATSPPVRRGIIPARAGFTPPPGAPIVGPGDHPRSRGVYSFVFCSYVRSTGSSPLARGLRVVDARQDGLRGIIPARAGFTASLPRRDCGLGDHPRSRGVYTPPC